MPKMKTNRGAAKRFKSTAKGKIKRSKAYGNHFATRKTTKQKRNLRKGTLVDETNQKSVRRMLPYL